MLQSRRVSKINHDNNMGEREIEKNVFLPPAQVEETTGSRLNSSFPPARKRLQRGKERNK